MKPLKRNDGNETAEKTAETRQREETKLPKQAKPIQLLTVNRLIGVYFALRFA